MTMTSVSRRSASCRASPGDARTTLLIQIYDTIGDSDLKESTLRFLAGRDKAANAKLIAVAKSEREDSDLRETAVRLIANADEATPVLIDVYDTIHDSDLKETVIRHLGSRGDAKAVAKLEAIAKGDSRLRPARRRDPSARA